VLNNRIKAVNFRTAAGLGILTFVSCISWCLKARKYMHAFRVFKG
jgi:hypothetical protein